MMKQQRRVSSWWSAWSNVFSVVPASVGRLASLEELYISRNPISSMGALQNRQYLDMSINQLSGRLPSREIYSMQSLQELHLSRNAFSGSVGKRLPNITGMPNLTSMCVHPDPHRKHEKGIFAVTASVAGFLTSETSLIPIPNLNNH
ncbi:hypothetical protein CcCBS67573_g03940 [Chytriomyces confervae]|uniref:Uncharacterized protein n=1 Tax=Chytriomyces confervae TaxID=246404 RepID=A0A507FF80_9FUNG|nr:hypothetical protein CcCBS67573_g03940 [Chytriomyces confervae]